METELCKSSEAKSFQQRNCAKNKRNLGALAICLLMLQGCSSTPTIAYVPDTRPVLQQNLAMPCPDLPKLENREYTEGEAVDAITEWVTLYKECQMKHEEMVNFVTEYLKTE